MQWLDFDWLSPEADELIYDVAQEYDVNPLDLSHELERSIPLGSSPYESVRRAAIIVHDRYAD